MRLKRIWILLAVVLLLTAVIVPSSYAEGTTTTASQSVKTLEVSGTGRIAYSFDTAEVTLGVSELADTPTGAFSAMSAKINQVISATKAKGIPESNLKTGYLSLYPEYNYNKDGVQTTNGFRATNTVTIKVKEITLVPAIMEAAIAAGANQVQGVTFSLSNPDALQGQAIDAAVDNARTQADRIAKKLGTSVKSVQKVQLVSQSAPTPIPYQGQTTKSASADRAGAPAVYGGQGDYTASVFIIYELN
jgi:uncharacterized protein YggE